MHALTCSLLTCLLMAGPEAEKKPNLVFILADDLGYGEVGAFGQKKIPTPNIDRLAQHRRQRQCLA